jgi:hypothetical protein
METVTYNCDKCHQQIKIEYFGEVDEGFMEDLTASNAPPRWTQDVKLCAGCLSQYRDWIASKPTEVIAMNLDDQ